MDKLRFDDRVAVITGAGRGLGRAYAELLASRGAKVVVNDAGVSMQGDSDDDSPAVEVVKAIKAAGGEALACTDSVATPEGGKAIIDAAMDSYGRVDILIHNAGIVRRAPLAEMSFDDFEAVLDVHLRGGFHVVRAAFPFMLKAGYGRLIMAGSINGLYGNRGVVNYSVAKAGLNALSHVAALEGADNNVKSNVILPAAVTRMSEGVDVSAFPPMNSDLVAPVVAWLAHESCSISGEMLISVAGRLARAYAAETPGIYSPDWTIEKVAAQIDSIRDAKAPVVFPVVPSGHLDHLRYSFEMVSGD
ncbi:MAG: SDR family NAD(P)-dependent oxidoreductase [Spongiibacteraceae bacterium]|nr:SDR family NAD(P)-dependent oxidoreductase [Spongiibacteraceae bacterium]MBN4055339.1 SDR family NAD(P)-dependent oxidoreductase [bacterium AH-315-K03]